MPSIRLSHDEIDASLLEAGWPIVHPAVMMRRDAVQAVGGYHPEYLPSEDHDLFLRLAERYFDVSMHDGYWKLYSIVIQLGAVLCVPIYFRKRIAKFISPRRPIMGL